MSTVVGIVLDAITKCLPHFDARYQLKGEGGGGLAAWYEFNLSPSPINIGNTRDAQGYMVNLLQIQPVQTYGNYQSQYVKQRYAVLSVPNTTWSTIDPETGLASMTTNVIITYGDGSKLTAPMTFTSSLPLADAAGLLWAARFSGGFDSSATGYGQKGYIDTGLTMNASYKFEAQGYVPYISSPMGVIIGAQKSTSLRTTLKIMTGSNKAQVQWYSQSELTASTAQVSFRKMFTYTQSAAGLTVGDGVNSYTLTNANWRTDFSDASTPILLFDETTTGSSASTTKGFRNAVIRYAKIYDADDNLLRYLRPAAISSGEYVFIDLANTTLEDADDESINVALDNGDFDIGGQYESKVHRPQQGALIGVTEEEYTEYVATL